jgi:hypothetical protein
MRTQLRLWFSIVAVLAGGMVIGRVSKGAEPDAAAMAVQLAQQMAAAASHRDAASNGKLIPQNARVVYVSNGNPITGKQYVETLGRYYASLKTLDFKWDKWEVVPIGANAAVFTGWASVGTVDQAGKSEAGRAIFTMVFARDATGWKRVIAQKWQAEVPAVRAVYPAGFDRGGAQARQIAVLLSEPVKATDAAFRLECPPGAPVPLDARADGAGSDSLFVLSPRQPLPPGASCKLTVVASQVADDHFGQNMTADYHFEFKVAGDRAQR